MKPPPYWFPAKLHGWGWGAPSAWQGWVVLAVFAVLLALGAFAFPPTRSPIGFIACTFVLSCALLAVCWLKGEPPSWRWGERPRRGVRDD